MKTKTITKPITYQLCPTAELLFKRGHYYFSSKLLHCRINEAIYILKGSLKVLRIIKMLVKTNFYINF